MEDYMKCVSSTVSTLYLQQRWVDTYRSVMTEWEEGYSVCVELLSPHVMWLCV